jgi:hypothetical protein
VSETDYSTNLRRSDSVWLLIVGGSLERAKELRKRHTSPSTEKLLVDAYAARIVSLMKHGIEVESKSAGSGAPEVSGLQPKTGHAVAPVAICLPLRSRLPLKTLRVAKLQQASREDGDGHVPRLVQSVCQLCRQHAPELAGKLRQRVAGLCALRGIEERRITPAVRGEVRKDFGCYRPFAFGMEGQD